MNTIVIIPALNAERTVGGVVRDALAHVETVLVVDDGSSDTTGAAAAAAGAVVVRHEINRGKGAALKTGFAWALERDAEGVVTLDADGQHLASEIPKFIAAHAEKNADLIVGGRAHLFHGMLPRRRLANRFSAWGVGFASGVGITDSQSGFRYYSAKLIRAVPLYSDGFDMESEVIVRAGRAGLHVCTIPIELGFVNGLATSHYKPVKDTLKIFWTVFKVLVATRWPFRA
ncbi:MAG: glycosyltransferase family 2 protein [Thermoanaerobaculia bacterium]|nr:glycosyltransferase family 2 protein [Thermoanaerobaculia bacterium]